MLLYSFQLSFFFRELVTAGIIPVLASFLIFDTDRLGLISEVSWVLTYLSAR